MTHPVVKKLRLHTVKEALVLNAPEGWISSLHVENGLSIDESTSGKKKYPFILCFVKDKAELKNMAALATGSMAGGAILWIAYPKKSSKVKTDISRDEGWGPVFERGVEPVTQIAIDETWSALRFRPVSEIPVMVRGTNPKNDSELEIPADLAGLLAKNPKAKETFETISFTYRKEYVMWIQGAKKEETRQRRLEKALKNLEAGEKFYNR